MGRVSTRLHKNIYQLTREALGLSRERAGDIIRTVSADRIEKIESGRVAAYPEEVLAMAEGYAAPQLCNYYCAKECAIGRDHVREVTMTELSGIVLEMLASLNSMKHKQDRLIEIAADGVIDPAELADFIAIQGELERLTVSAEALRIWTEKMLAKGDIDLDEYRKHADGKKPEATGKDKL